jgi:hypothetical protein
MSKRAGVAPLRLAPGKGSSHKARFRALDSYGTEKGPEVAQATGVTGAGEGGEVMPHSLPVTRWIPQAARWIFGLRHRAHREWLSSRNFLVCLIGCESGCETRFYLSSTALRLCTSVCMFLISRDLVQHLASAVNVVVYKSRLRTYTTQMFRCMCECERTRMSECFAPLERRSELCRTRRTWLTWYRF